MDDEIVAGDAGEAGPAFGGLQTGRPPASGAGAMAARREFERAACSIAALGRDELKERIRHFKGRFRLDFTDDYINSLSIDRLRHILLAAVITRRHHN